MTHLKPGDVEGEGGGRAVVDTIPEEKVAKDEEDEDEDVFEDALEVSGGSKLVRSTSEIYLQKKRRPRYESFCIHCVVLKGNMGESRIFSRGFLSFLG